MGNYTTFGGCENPRRGRQARNLTTNVPKILDLESNRLQNRYFPKNFDWVLLFLLHLLATVRTKLILQPSPSWEVTWGRHDYNAV